jgi:hypothetical protein
LQLANANGQQNLSSSFLGCNRLEIQCCIPDLLDPHDRLFCFLVGRMLAAKPAIFVKFQLIRRRALILGCRVVSAFALGASQGNNNSHLNDSLPFIR